MKREREREGGRERLYLKYGIPTLDEFSPRAELNGAVRMTAGVW